MRRWRRPCRTRGTWTATTCGAPAGSTRRSRSSRAADALETAYFAAEKIPVEYDWHYQHNLDLLATSYQYIGQMRKAEELFKRSFAIPSSLRGAGVQQARVAGVPARARACAGGARRRERAWPAHRSPVVSAAGHVEAGRARLALGQFKEAADEGNTALRLMRGAEGAGLVADAAAGASGRVLPAHRQGGAGAADARRGRAEGARARPGPTRGRRRCSRSRRSRARRARSATGNCAGWAARQMVEHDPNYAGSHYALALVAEHARRRANRPRRTGAGREVLEERGSRI